MANYSDIAAENIIQRLSEVAPELQNIKYEIQDGGQFLLLMASVDQSGGNGLDATLRGMIFDHLISNLPERKDDHSWMLVVYCRGVMVDSIFPNLETS